MSEMTIPRRCRLDLYTPAETAISEAMKAVEAAGCDTRLTEAVIMLAEARDKVADFVDGIRGESSPLPEVSEAERAEHEANKDPDRRFAEQIFFHVLLRGGEGNPFTKIRNEWFIELVAPKIAELLGQSQQCQK